MSDKPEGTSRDPLTAELDFGGTEPGPAGLGKSGVVDAALPGTDKTVGGPAAELGVDDPLASLRTGREQALAWPKDHLKTEPAAELAKVDIEFLSKIDDPVKRAEGAAAIAAVAETQGAYKEALIANHRAEALEVAAHARFTVQLEAAGKGAEVLHFSNDPAESMERFAQEAKRDFISAQPAGTSVSLTDSASKLDAARTSEGNGAFREQFGKDEGREAFAAAQVSIEARTLAEKAQPAVPDLVIEDRDMARVASTRERDSAAARKDLGVGESEANERFVQELDSRMAKSELEELGWRDRTDLSDVMRDLETLAGRDWQTAAKLWDKYRPGDIDKPIFIDGDDVDVVKPSAKTPQQVTDERANTVDRERSPKDQDDEKKEFVTPESLRKRYLQADTKFYFRDDENRLAFEDKGKRLATDHNDPAIALSMVELAQAKGWKALKLKGDDEFMRAAWLQASLRGMEVSGYEPRDVDRAKLADMRKEPAYAAYAADKPADKALNTIEQGTAKAKAVEQPERAVAAPERAAVPEKAAVIDEHHRTLSEPQRMAVETLKGLLRARGDSEKAVDMAAELAAERFQNNRVHVGKVLEHGAAPYEHNKDNEQSYYVKLQTPAGDKTVWGVDLQRAMSESKSVAGDEVALAYQGKQAVTVQVKQRDSTGKVTGTTDLVTNRNAWDVNRLENVREEVKQRLTEAAQATERQPLVKVYDRNAQRAEPRVEVVREPVRDPERARG
ncbi:LPD7 domain-containing protein [Variovorax sp. VaC1]|uniref:LPD7 domain-containing protein n=1 Tax=Variovorax sp. VaC1 TaxID=3373132 RepID=UPI003748B741